MGCITPGNPYWMNGSALLTSLYQLVLTSFYSYLNYIFLFFYKTTYLNKQVNRTEPSPSARALIAPPPRGRSCPWGKLCYRTGSESASLRLTAGSRVPPSLLPSGTRWRILDTWWRRETGRRYAPGCAFVSAWAGFHSSDTVSRQKFPRTWQLVSSLENIFFSTSLNGGLKYS